jgi:YggT family protein
VDYEIANLLIIALLATLNITLQIILYSIIGAVIISWVAQGNDHPLLRLVEEISFKVLAPIKNIIPAMGGLDISPLIGLVFIQYLQSFIGGLIQSLV